MSLEEKKYIDSIEVTSDGFLIVKKITEIINSTEIIAKKEYRYAIDPGTDLSNEDPKITAIANAVWTKEIIDAYKAKITKPVSSQTNTNLTGSV